MEKSLLTACDFIITSNKKLTSMKIMCPNENANSMDLIIESFFTKFPKYKDKILIQKIDYEIREGNKRKNNPELVKYLILVDKIYLKEKEEKIFPLLIKKCILLKKKNDLVDILDLKVSNLDELEILIQDFYKENPLYKNEFSFNAEKDKSQYFISIMDMEKYRNEIAETRP